MRESKKPTDTTEDGLEKSERKRQREKQRRSELTNAFEDLAALVLKVDTDEDQPEGGDVMRKKGRRMSHGESDSGGMTRVDLINKALTIMKRLHAENTELKQSLARSGGGSNEVMVMIPTLTPADDAAPPPPPPGSASASNSYRPPYMSPGFAPMPPQQDHSHYPPHHPQPGGWGPYHVNGPAPPHYGGPERGHSIR